MRRKEEVIGKQNLRLLTLFICLFSFLIFISLSSKAISVIKKSKYDSSYPLFLKINTAGKTKLLLLDSKEKKAFIIDFAGEGNRDYIEDSISIFTDLYIEDKMYKDIHSLDNIFWDRNGVKTNLTIIDLLKIGFLTRNIDDSNISNKTINLDKDSLILESLPAEILTDKNIVSEGKKIQVINASGEDGIGGRVAKTLSLLGANVVLVSTDIRAQENSSISYVGEESYTLKRIVNLFKPEEIKREQNNNFADITIKIGKKDIERIF